MEYSFCRIEDLSRLDVFDDASNATSLLVAKRQRPATVRVPTVIWLPTESATIASDTPLDEVLRITRREQRAAEPVDPLDVRSPLLITGAGGA